MEFLSTLLTIGQLISKGVELGKLAFAKKSETFKNLKDSFTELKEQLNTEGERIEKYDDFMKLIANVTSAISSIRKSHDDINEEQTFWNHITEYQEDLYRLGVAELENFDTEIFLESDRHKINANRPILSRHILGAREQFEQQNRERYLEYIRDTMADVGTLKAVGAKILENLGKDLRNFGR